MKKYNCLLCNYHTDNKTMYGSRHLLSAKHIGNIRKNSIKCKYCGDYFLESKLETHIKTDCINYKNMELKEQYFEMKKKDFEIEKLKLINEKLKIINEKDREINKKDKEINAHLIEANEFLKTINTKTQSNIKFILENYKNAPQFSIPDFSMTRKEIMNCVSKGYVRGVSDLILKLFPPDIEPTKRCFWTLDLSRNKYIIKTDKGEWDVDINAKNITNIFIPELYQKVDNEYTKILNEKDINNIIEKHATNEEVEREIKNILEKHKEDGLGRDGFFELVSFLGNLKNNKNSDKIMKEIGDNYIFKI